MRNPPSRATLWPVALAGLAAAGFSAPGHKWAASSYPVHYRLHDDGAPGVTDGSDLAAIRRAFTTWQGVACSNLTFTEQGWMEPRVIANDGVHRIYWATERGAWPGEPGTLALTYTFYRLADNVITDADIVSNGVDWEWTTQDGMVTNRRVDVETVLFHEIGHFFGLQHSNDPNAAMFPSNNTPLRRQPANDDIAGICTLYPNGMPIPNSANPNMAGSVGAPCQAADNCRSSLCVDDMGSAYCTAQCNPADRSTCPVQYPCTATSQGNFCLLPVVTDELCDQCSAGTQCQTGLCLTVPGYNYFRPFCTRACDPTPGGAAQCPDGYRCEVVQNNGQTGGVCAPTTGVCNPTGKGGHNEGCFANGGCKPGHTCIQYAPGVNFCFFECSPQLIGVSCSDDGRITCLPVSETAAFGRMGIAACFNVSRVGEPCLPAVCESGAICLFDEQRGTASALCYQVCPSGGCPANTQCSPVEGVGSICLPNAGFKPLGASCAGNAECVSNTCRTYGQENLCTQVCATTDATGCPAGLRCIAAEGTVQGLCWPENTVVPSNRGKELVLPADFCACDTTSSCDKDCPCDKECTAGGCTCDGTAGGGLGWLALALLLVRRRFVV